MADSCGQGRNDGYSPVPLNTISLPTRIRDADGSQAGRSTTRDSSRDLADLDVDAAAKPEKANGGDEKAKDLPPILKYLKTQVRSAGTLDKPELVSEF